MGNRDTFIDVAAYSDDYLAHNIGVHDHLCCVVRLSQMHLPMGANDKSSSRDHLRTRGTSLNVLVLVNVFEEFWTV